MSFPEGTGAVGAAGEVKQAVPPKSEKKRREALAPADFRALIGQGPGAANPPAALGNRNIEPKNNGGQKNNKPRRKKRRSLGRDDILALLRMQEEEKNVAEKKPVANLPQSPTGRLSFGTVRERHTLEDDTEALQEAIEEAAEFQDVVDYASKVANSKKYTSFQKNRELGAVFYYLHQDETELAKSIQDPKVPSIYKKVRDEGTSRVDACKGGTWKDLPTQQRKKLPSGVMSTLLLFFTELLLTDSNVWNIGGTYLVISLIEGRLGSMLKLEHYQTLFNTLKLIMNLGDTFAAEVAKQRQCHKNCVELVQMELKLPLAHVVSSVDVNRSALYALFSDLVQVDGMGNCFAIGLIKAFGQVRPLRLFLMYCGIIERGTIYIDKYDDREFSVKDLNDIAGYNTPYFDEELLGQTASDLFCVSKTLECVGEEEKGLYQGVHSLKEHFECVGKSLALKAEGYMFSFGQSLLQRVLTDWMAFYEINDTNHKDEDTPKAAWINELSKKIVGFSRYCLRDYILTLPEDEGEIVASQFEKRAETFKSYLQRGFWLVYSPQGQETIDSIQGGFESEFSDKQLMDTNYLLSDGCQLAAYQESAHVLFTVSSFEQLARHVVYLFKMAFNVSKNSEEIELPAYLGDVYNWLKERKTTIKTPIQQTYLEALAKVINLGGDIKFNADMVKELGAPWLYNLGGRIKMFSKYVLELNTTERKVEVDNEKDFVCKLAQEFSDHEILHKGSLLKAQQPVLLFGKDHLFMCYPFRMKEFFDNPAKKLVSLVEKPAQTIMKKVLTRTQMKRVIQLATIEAPSLKSVRLPNGAIAYKPLAFFKECIKACKKKNGKKMNLLREQRKALEMAMGQVMHEVPTTVFMQKVLTPLLKKLFEDSKLPKKQLDAIRTSVRKQLNKQKGRVNTFSPLEFAHTLKNTLLKMKGVLKSELYIEQVICGALNLPVYVEIGDLNYQHEGVERAHHIALVCGFDYTTNKLALFERKKDTYTKVSARHKKSYFDMGLHFIDS